MEDRVEAWKVFFDRWNGATKHIARVSPRPENPGERSQGFIPIDDARDALIAHLTESVGVSPEDAARLGSGLALEVVIWAHLDGIDRDRLASRLRAVQAKHLDGPGVASHEAESGRIRPVRLPDKFYLPRLDDSGREHRDALPWKDADEYVSDGIRYGMRLTDGTIRWFEDAPRVLMDLLESDFEGVDVEGVITGLKEYIARRDPLPLELAEEVAALEAVLIERRSHVEPT